jgi:hypothetical protein
MRYPSPRSYRWSRGIEETDLAMAAVVMRVLDPSIAGVTFTVDPGGKPNAVRLEVVEGLGEQLVSGADTTYTTAGVTEMLPGVLPPMLWGIVGWLVKNGFRSLFEMLGGGAEERQGVRRQWSAFALLTLPRQGAVSRPSDAAATGVAVACLSAGKTSRSDGCHTGLSPAVSTLKP